MMKKVYLLCFIALFALVVGASAQKNKKFDQSMLKSKSDSLSYALGQSVSRGLKQYLTEMNILIDTTANALIEGYDEKIDKADESEKIALIKEYYKKLKEAVAANETSFRSFQEGIEDAIISADERKRSYNSGLGLGSQLLSFGERFEKEMLSGDKLNKDAFLNSILTVLNEENPLIEDADEFIQSAAMKKQEEENIKRAEELKAIHGDRISEGVKFLAENKEKDGVITLPSGLQYKVLAEGDGVKPLESDQVTVHYEGRLLDGTVFDSSYKRGNPATFGVTQVIKGWTEALQIMPVGSKWTIYVPYDLGYGSADQGVIKPYSTLIFDIELLDVVK